METDEKKYILYGAGHDGIVAMRYLGKENIICFCDSAKRGSAIEGIPIIAPEEIDEKTELGTVVIAVSRVDYVLEIAKMLLSKDIDFVFWQDIVKSVIREEGERYNVANTYESLKYDKTNEYLISTDRYGNAGEIKSYFWQDLWAAQHICRSKPQMHYDIGSRVDGFIAHLLSYGQDVTMIDIRPLDIRIKGLSFIKADATNLESVDDNSIESLSALCSLEHFGLGRYGDEIDPDACFKCFNAIQRKMKKNGRLYISVPIGKEHLVFNAHRIFRAQTLINCFDKMELIEFSSCCHDRYEENIEIHKYDEWTDNSGSRFGLFLFRKK